MKRLLPLLLAFLSPVAFAAAAFSVEGIIHLVIYLVILGLIFWLIWWFIGYVNPPEPFNKVIRVLIGLAAIVILLYILLGLLGPLPTLR